MLILLNDSIRRDLYMAQLVTHIEVSSKISEVRSSIWMSYTDKRTDKHTLKPAFWQASDEVELRALEALVKVTSPNPKRRTESAPGE